MMQRGTIRSGGMAVVFALPVAFVQPAGLNQNRYRLIWRTLMFTLVKAVRSVLKCALMVACALPLAANAAAPVAPAKQKPYQPAVQNEVTVVYQYRTRILAKPECQRFATEADAAFLDDKLTGEAKVVLLKRIGAEAGAKACLAP
ncbi:MAG: hypothetical protein OEL86_00075 [Sulfuritalea sp.]|jgi:hypothetical protein|nr:hypothetical protein [Sulfuritalea sp.]